MRIDFPDPGHPAFDAGGAPVDRTRVGDLAAAVGAAFPCHFKMEFFCVLFGYVTMLLADLPSADADPLADIHVCALDRRLVETDDEELPA